MTDPKNRNELYSLIMQAVEGNISDDDFFRLQERLKLSDSDCDVYAEIIIMCSLLHKNDYLFDSCKVEEDVAGKFQDSQLDLTEASSGGCRVSGESNVSLRGVDMQDVLSDENPADADAYELSEDSVITQSLRDLLEYERTAPAFVIPKEESDRELIQKVVHKPVEKHKPSKFQIFTLIMSSAAMLFFAIFLKFAPQPVPSVDIATLTDQMNVQWGDSGFKYENGERLWTNDFPLDLKKGIVSIEYDEGVEVVIEGPALFEIERSGVYLEYGRLYGKVSETGLGFTVRTPTSQFVDQGTEFGVQADINGSSELHVTKGKVQLFAGLKKKSRISQMVTENAAARYDADTGKVGAVKVRKNAFVRRIDSDANLVWKGQKLNLADVVGGGNGFGSGTIDRVINLDTGRVSPRGYDAYALKPTPGQCIRVPELALVDCLFVPDGGIGVDQVSLDGVRFENCPDTSGVSHGDISNGGIVRHDVGRSNTLVLDGVTYGTQQRPAIYIHGNQGITYDLEAIRKSIPGIEIVRFTSLCGVSQTVADDPTYSGSEPNTSFWVLVDGKVRFSKGQAKLAGKASEISVDLTGQDRYLSLVVTDGDGVSSFDWGVFAMPELKLDSK